MSFRWLALLTGLALAMPLYAEDWNADEKAVWQLDEDYWRYVSAGDVESCVKLWHDDFVGWPCFEWKPVRKVDIGKWMRVGNDWQIIGGMCAAQEPVKVPRG